VGASPGERVRSRDAYTAAMTEIRFITDDEIPAFRRAVAFGFGDDLTEEEGGDDRFRETFPLETCIAAFDDGQIVATFGSFDFDVTIPGGTLPMAGTTIVTVQPTHRRRRVLTTMMRMHLDQAIDRGQPLAGLWASEPIIYGRFGYGLAAHAHELAVRTDRVTLPEGPDTDTVRIIDPEDAPATLPPIYDRVRLETPGMLSRSEAWWRHRRLYDPVHWRDGASSRRIAVASRDGVPVGYVAYRQKEKFEDWLPEGTVSVIEVIALDDDARRTLWHYLAGIDLFPNVRWWNAPADDPLSVEVDNMRRVTTRLQDTLYLRILDIPAALSTRTYESDGTIAIRVIDDFMDRGGTFRLEVNDGIGSCSATSDDPDVTMDVSDLGALFLGRPQAFTLWRADRVSGDEGSIRTLDRLLRTARLPYCSEVF
jgi:predicted acetyltransferase